jgi:hypothetical protein
MAALLLNRIAQPTSYATSMHSELNRFSGLTNVDRSLLANNVGAAINAVRRLGVHGTEIASVARTAFVDSMHSSLWIAAALAFGAAMVAFTQLPRHITPTTHATHATSPLTSANARTTLTTITKETTS